MKVDIRTKKIFAHAVALDQNGRLRNTIFVKGKYIYILNSDNTVLLRCTSKADFKKPIAFHANDYDSDEFFERDGAIVFVQRGGDRVREKSCRPPESTPKVIEELFESFPTLDEGTTVDIPETVIPLLGEGLSHIEFFGKENEFHIVQRNIHSGVVIDITKEKGGLGLKVDEVENFGPIGLRSNDFQALYSFNPSIRFTFQTGLGYCTAEGHNFGMKAIIAQCVYDELGLIENVEEVTDGRKKPKDRRSKPKADRGTKTKRKRKRSK